MEPGVEGGQPGTSEQALVARQDSPCKSSNSNCSLLCLVWKKLQEGRPSSLLFFSAPQATSLPLPAPLPKLAVSLPLQADLGHSIPPALGSALTASLPLALPGHKKKSWLIKHPSPSQGCNDSWVRSSKYVQPGSQGHFSIKPLDENFTHLQHPSLKKYLTLSPSL